MSKIDSVIENGTYKDNWESLSAYPVANWYREAKFGVFIHWGIYSVPAYFSEWYVRLMYYKGNPIYWHHMRKYGKSFNYRDFIPMFKAENFSASQWVKTLKNSGAKFIMPVGEHHDGFKMYDSQMNQWTSVNMGPKMDILGELKTECDKQGMVFSTSSHRAEHYWFLNGGRTLKYKNEPQSEEFRDFYGPAVTVHKGNSLRVMLKQEHGIKPTEDWLQDWLVSSCELVDRYQPASLFFDWWVSEHSFRPYIKKFLAYYYNRSVEWGKEVCVYYKSDAVMYNCAMFDRERGQLEGTSPYCWQSETSTSRNAWSYCTTNRWKSPQEIACVFADVISKNGNFVLNIGPKADGTICNEEQNILAELGKWTAKNNEAIWGTCPYKIFGEGKKQKSGSFSERYGYTSKDYRFTYKCGVIYAFALVPNGKKDFVIKSFADSMDMFHFDIKKISILGDDTKITFAQNKKRLAITANAPIKSKMPICFKIEVD